MSTPNTSQAGGTAAAQAPERRGDELVRLDSTSTGDHRSVTVDTSITATTDDASIDDGAGDEEDEGRSSKKGQAVHRRKRQRGDFPWSYTHDWESGDPPRARGRRQCVICKKWFSGSTNGQGWKVHLSNQHRITKMSLSSQQAETDTSSAFGRGLKLPGSQQTIDRMALPTHTLRIYENAVVDFVIGGDISLRAAGESRFQQFVSALTNGYKPPSTRTILRRIVELFSIAEPLLAQFLSNLDVCVSLTMDWWSNRNLKGFYVVTAHWIDTTTGAMKSLLLTILDVSCGTGVGNRVGSALFSYLMDVLGTAFLPRLLHVVTDNGSDACAAVARLFQLINSHLGSRVLQPSSNHVRCADHSVQRGVISVLAQVKEINEKLRGALVSIRRSKVLRQAYRQEADRLGYTSKEPTHQDSPTRWNSTHEMCSDALAKREALDQTMMLHEDDVGSGPLTDSEWSKIAGVMNFLRAPRQVMESLAADRKSSLDLVQLSLSHLIKHCEVNEEQLKRIDTSLTASGMKRKLESYEKKLVQLPAIVAGYLNPQIPKPTDARKLKDLKDTIRLVLKERYADKMEPLPTRPVSDSLSDTSLFEALFASSGGDALPSANDDIPISDEVDRYLGMGIVMSTSFIDVIQWWMARKDVLPAHYQMAMDYLGTPATSTPSERVNSMAGQEFTSARQSLSSEIFVKTMCLRSWIKAKVINIPSDRQKALAALVPRHNLGSPGGRCFKLHCCCRID